MNKIVSFGDFINALYETGFTVGGSNGEGVFTLAWRYGENIQDHTENPETDPWEWRMRVLNECDDIAYSKLFFNKSGYITKAWYPYFLAARRAGKDLRDAYFSGTISHIAKRIYEIVEQHETIPLHIIKREGNFGKEDKSKFDRAITELQMKMYITMCGNARKLSVKGGEYGWSSTMFCTVERFWNESVFEKASAITQEEAIEKIIKKIYLLNPNAEDKKINKFIGV